MKKGKTFDYYLQEALKELEKPCEEFNSERCERLLTKCCRVLLEGVNENAEGYGKNKDGNGNSNDSLSENVAETKLEVKDVFKERNSENGFQVSCSSSSGIRSGTFLNSNSRAVLGISSDTGSFGSVRRSSGRRSGELFSGFLSQDREEVIGEKSIVLSSTSHNRSCSFAGNGLNGSCNGVFTACSSVFSPCRLTTSRGRDADSSYGRFHSNPPKGELNEKQGKACEDQRLFTVAVEIDSLSGETVQVKADSPEKALAEALQKLTPGVKTVVWGEE